MLCPREKEFYAVDSDIIPRVQNIDHLHFVDETPLPSVGERADAIEPCLTLHILKKNGKISRRSKSESRWMANEL